MNRILLGHASALFASSLLTGCLGPLADDTPRYSAHLLPADRRPPSISTSASLAAKIDRNDATVDSVIPLHEGYADGSVARYWDFGVSASLPTPIWVLRRCGEMGVPLEGTEGLVDHPPLIDTIPGDLGYTAFWWIWNVCVTPAYAGERIPSLEALDDALDLGLVLDPAPTTLWFNAPIALDSAELDVGDGVASVSPVYYRGYLVGAAPLGGLGVARELPRSRLVPVGVVYLLEKKEDKDFSEMVFGATPALDADEYTPLVEIVHVVVEEWYAPGTVRDAASLVGLVGGAYEPIHPDVVSVDVTGELRNLEIQPR